MKILLITSEEWNDFTFANGVLTNWFTDLDVEVAQIYTSPGLPINNICERYFQITDSQMARSIFGMGRAGGVIYKSTDNVSIEFAKQNAQRKGIYGFMKHLSLYWRTPIMLAKDFIWDYGKYNTSALDKFVKDFNPDVVFCPRYVSKRLMRLERIVSKMTNAPFIAFTADDEISMENVRWWQLEYYRRWFARRQFKKHVKLYSHYFTFSIDQATEYQKEYGIPTSTLLKCADFSKIKQEKPIGSPIRLVYAGHIYCNRWKSLCEIGKALKTINKENVKMVLDVYTMDTLTSEQRKALSSDNYIYIKGRVTPTELKKVYEEADIALHVESLDKHYRMVTRVSFSTKIIDLMASTCAIMAICWEKHAGYEYLKANDASFCCPDYKSILPQLEKICATPDLINEYRVKAISCGLKNHSRHVIHDIMINTFKNTIKKNKRNDLL